MTICNMYGMPIIFDEDLESKIDMSFFGTKYIGKISIRDMKENIFKDIFLDLECDKWLEEYFSHCLTKNDDTKIKYNEIKENIHGKYDVRFDIGISFDILGSFSSRTSFKGVFFKINIYIDDILMVENEVDDMWCEEELAYYPIISRDYEFSPEYSYENYGLLYNIKNYCLKKKQMEVINEELMMKALHPNRLIRHIELGGDIEDF